MSESPAEVFSSFLSRVAKDLKQLTEEIFRQLRLQHQVQDFFRSQQEFRPPGSQKPHRRRRFPPPDG